jgi:hypothetical protein
MKARDLNKFIALVGITTPKANALDAAVVNVKNWALLHPVLADLEANEAGLNVCRLHMYAELYREEGPRYHIMDRLYKRFSNLRREIETSAMNVLLPELEEEPA